MMTFFILSFEKEHDIVKFVNFWSSFYDYKNEYLYSQRIDKQQFTVNDIEKLFEWKNGGHLSQKKKDSLRWITNKLKIINKLKSNFNIDNFKSEFDKVSTIWKIYLLHIVSSKDYPIFDQHVCRAFYFLTNNKIKEIPSKNLEKEKLYFECYVKFYNDIAIKVAPPKKLDEALWTFGRFLKTYYRKIIH